MKSNCCSNEHVSIYLPSIQSILRQSCSINHSFIIPSTDPPSHFSFIPPSTQYLIAWGQKLFALGRLNGTGYLLDN